MKERLKKPCKFESQDLILKNLYQSFIRLELIFWTLKNLEGNNIISGKQ